MRRHLLLLFFVLLLFPCVAGAQTDFFNAPGMSTTEQDGVPDVQCISYVFDNGSVTDNGDGTCDIAGGSGGAPDTATYITQTPDATLSAEQAMSLLGTGITINTTTTGVQSIYAGTSCTNQFVRSLDASGAATCATVVDADVDDGITASNYLLLAGGTLTGQLVTDNLGIEFEDSDTNPTCAAGNYNIYADLSETTLKKCINGVATDLDTGAASFTDITTGTNTTATMTVGTGASIAVSGSGTVTATDGDSASSFFSTGTIEHERGGLEFDASAVVDADFIVGTGAGTMGLESGATARTSLGVSIGSDVQAWDAELDTLAGLTETNGAVIFAAGGVWTSDTTPALDATDMTNLPTGESTTAGRSLTLSTFDVAADAELYTDSKGAWIDNPTVEAIDEIYFFMSAATITRVQCWTDTGTATLNIENASDADVLSADLVCDAGGQSSCASGCDVNTIQGANDNFAAFAEGDIDISAVASSPTKVSVFIGYTLDD
jgi:hypothetical protein